jgi:hypothetical protein
VSAGITVPFTGVTGVFKNHWWITFHLMRYSWSGTSEAGCAAVRWAPAFEEWPCGMTGRSYADASAQIFSVSVMPPHQ